MNNKRPCARYGILPCRCPYCYSKTTNKGYELKDVYKSRRKATRERAIRDKIRKHGRASLTTEERSYIDHIDNK